MTVLGDTPALRVVVAHPLEVSFAVAALYFVLLLGEDRYRRRTRDRPSRRRDP